MLHWTSQTDCVNEYIWPNQVVFEKSALLATSTAGNAYENLEVAPVLACIESVQHACVVAEPERCSL